MASPMNDPKLEALLKRLHVQSDAQFEFVHDPKNRFRTLTVPFEGGFEPTVRV